MVLGRPPEPGRAVVVGTGLLATAAFYLWVTTTSAGTPYWEIALQMVVLGTGMGLTSAPATEAIMGVVSQAKAGVGSAMNDATRLLGGTLGVAIIGSVYSSAYSSSIVSALSGRNVPAQAATAISDSIGGAIGVAGPSEGNCVKMTHRPWIVDGDALGEQFGIPVLVIRPHANTVPRVIGIGVRLEGRQDHDLHGRDRRRVGDGDRHHAYGDFLMDRRRPE